MHPNSLANLKREGKELTYGEPKRDRRLTVTTTGWEGAKAAAKESGFASVSDFLEQLGRGRVQITLTAEDVVQE
ncbi:MAG: hypothetical protein VKL39_15975 [Leptolyngbyaceae bacterium]|nr:hypothetical protein [Leptolyngbyaceae bacterium]